MPFHLIAHGLDALCEATQNSDCVQSPQAAVDVPSVDSAVSELQDAIRETDNR
jgi:hypothetical protein